MSSFFLRELLQHLMYFGGSLNLLVEEGLGGVYLLTLVCLLWRFGGFRQGGKCRRVRSGSTSWAGRGWGAMEVFASCRSVWPGVLYYNMDSFKWLYLVTRNFEWQQDNHDSQCCRIHKSSQKAKNGDPSGTLKYLLFISSERREQMGSVLPLCVCSWVCQGHWDVVIPYLNNLKSTPSKNIKIL